MCLRISYCSHLFGTSLISIFKEFEHNHVSCWISSSFFFFFKEGTQTWTNVLGKQRPSLFLFLLCSPFHLGMAWLTYNSFCLLWVCLCTWIHYLACEVFIYLAKVLLCWTFWPFPWTILWQEINVLFKWFISFSVNLGNKIKLTFSKNKGAVGCEKHLLGNKNLCLLRVQFLLKNKHHRPSENEEKTPADTRYPWLMMLSWLSDFRNGNQGTNGLGFIQ